jgi:hypothetical protein
MDDRSRQLEREISQARPKPFKQDKREKVLIVDDFGEVKSGEYLKVFVKILSVISLVCIVAIALFYNFYAQQVSREAVSTKERLVLAQKKINDLSREKEILMARLVISGKDPSIEFQGTKKGKDLVADDETKNLVVPKPEGEDKINKVLVPEQVLGEQEKSNIQPPLIEKVRSPEMQVEKDLPKTIEKTVALEKFTVIKEGATGDLLVRFDIRNVSQSPGDVSGRIFIVLKQDHDFEDDWLVTPQSAIENGIPSEYKKGQYFSIAHFKPVKFRIKHPDDPEFYKKASVFVFNEQADLIFEKLINITDAVESVQ